MKIESLEIKNFRTFFHAVIPFNAYTCLVGANGSGKSTALAALNLFFRDPSVPPLTEEDFHKKNTTDPIEIIVTFSDLSAEAQADFANYYRHGKLTISAVAKYDAYSKSVSVEQHGQRLVMDDFRLYFEADKAKASAGELKEIYSDLTKKYPLPEESAKQRMLDALRLYEETNPALCRLVPSPDHFYGVSKGQNLLAKYVQWVFIPAVKDVTNEQNETRETALGKLLARTVRTKVTFGEKIKDIRLGAQKQYVELLDGEQEKLASLSSSLSTRLASWAHPGASLKIEWQQDVERVIKIDEPYARLLASEGVFQGDLRRFGHGYQRSLLMALLYELSQADDANEPTLLLGIEEPELYQHPPQSRYLSGLLSRLTEGRTQVVVCTHSPFFVSGRGFEDVRLIRKGGSGESTASFIGFDALSAVLATARGGRPSAPTGIRAKVHQSLQANLNEIFFSPVVVLVEGQEDKALLATYVQLTSLDEEWRRLGIHIVPVNKKSEMVQPYAILRSIGVPTFAIFDADSNCSAQARPKHELDNKALLQLSGQTASDAFPTSNLWFDNMVVWSENLTVVLKADFPTDEWVRVTNETEAEYGHIGDLAKNELFIADRLVKLWESGHKSENLENLCNAIVQFAKNARGEVDEQPVG